MKKNIFIHSRPQNRGLQTADRQWPFSIPPKEPRALARVGSIILALLIFFNVNSYALETTLLDMRNEIFEESKVIKSLLADSKDIILMNSMWDSCVMTMTQLDAYFSMVGLFNTIKRENLSEASIDYLINWLNDIKKTNELNLKSLNSISVILESKTKVYLEKLKSHFSDLNNRIDSELGKISLLKESLKIK